MKLRLNARSPSLFVFGDDPKQVLRKPVIYMVVAGHKPSPIANVTSVHDIESRIGLPVGTKLPNDFRDMNTKEEFEEFGRLNVLALAKACLESGLRLRLMVLPSDASYFKLPYLESQAQISRRFSESLRRTHPADYLSWSKEHELHLKSYELAFGQKHLTVGQAYNALQDFPLELIVESGFGSGTVNGLDVITSITFDTQANVSVKDMVLEFRRILAVLDSGFPVAKNGDLVYLGTEKVTINLIRSFTTINSDQVLTASHAEDAAIKAALRSEQE